MEKCILCGKSIHHYQMNNAAPLANGYCCVSCHYGYVFPTRMNNGKPSTWATKENENGKKVTYYRLLTPAEIKELKKRSMGYEQISFSV